jgi:hypothetical protein
MTRLDAVNFISHGIAKAPGRISSARARRSGSPKIPAHSEAGRRREREKR